MQRFTGKPAILERTGESPIPSGGWSATNLATAADATDTNAGDPQLKKLSSVTAAIKVLTESTEPLNAKEIIDAMVAKGYWTSPRWQDASRDALQRNPSESGQR